MPAAPPTFPVLTGSPVAGMAYLDRPSPAGYFIFPDLSVRHEGYYRLSFSLFEELKDSKNADVEPPEGSPDTRDKLLSSNPMAPRAHVHFRLEVKSTPFSVFSAKKFPGLSESTPLSRTVAEQGCRVRIRRDVRMRRRDKPSEGYQGDYDDERYGHAERYGTPQHPSDRPRSISNGSIDAHTPYSNGRRPSVHDYFHQQGSFTPASYQQQPPPPPPPPPSQAASSYGPHLSFGGSVSTPAFPPPPMQQQQQQQPLQPYVPNCSSFQYPPTGHSRQISAPQNYGYQQTQQQISNYPSSVNYTEHQGFVGNPDYFPIMDHRRAPAMLITPKPPQPVIPQTIKDYVQNHSVIQQPHYTSQPQLASRTATPNLAHHQVPPQLPPLRTENFAKQGPMEPKYEPKSPSNSMPKPIVPSPSYTDSYYDSYATAVQSTNSMSNPLSNTVSTPMSGRNVKRDFGAVFDTSHMNQPIYNGMRPNSADHGRDRGMIETDSGEIEYDNFDDFRAKTLVYKRADGSHQAKKCPTPLDASR